MMTKHKTRIFVISIIVLISITFYLLLNNSCLNLIKVVKSYKDFGYSNVKSCHITSVKSIVRTKIPSLFSFLSDLKRHYVGNNAKDILNLDQLN